MAINCLYQINTVHSALAGAVVPPECWKGWNNFIFGLRITGILYQIQSTDRLLQQE